MRLRTIFFVQAILLSLVACRLDKPRWDTAWMAPIAWSDLTPANIFGDSLVGYDPQRRVYFAYDREVFRIPLDTLLEIPDTGFTYGLTLPGEITIYPGNPLTVYNNYTVFAVPDFAINQLVVGSGKVRIRAETAVQARVKVNYSVPKARLNGVPFYLSDTILPAPPGGTSVLEREIDLSGYTFDLTGDDNLKANRIRIIITAEIPAGDPPLPVPAGTLLVNTELRFRGIRPYFARGSIAPRTFELGPETLSVSLFHLIQSGQFYITEPSVKVILENGIGADLSARITELRGLNERTGQAVALQSPFTLGYLQLGRAVNQPSASLPYTPVFYEAEANAANSNLKAFIENAPHRVILKGKATLNPIPGAGAGQDFVYSVSKTAARLQIWFPMGFSFNQLVLADTVPYNAENLPGADKVQRLRLSLILENTYPFSLSGQVYVVDEAGQMVDSLFNSTTNSGVVIPAAEVSLTGFPNQPVKEVWEAVLEGTRKDIFLRGKRLSWKLRFHTPWGTTPPVFYDFYSLKTRLVARADVRL